MSSAPSSMVQVPVFGNVFAPQWMAGDCMPSTPPGYEDLYFMYGPGTDGTVTLTNASPGNLLVNQAIPIDADADWWFWRFDFTYIVSGGALIGDVGIRWRDGKGRQIMSDFCVIEDLRGAVLPPLKYSAGETLLFDLQNRGTHTGIQIQFEYHGFKRRKLPA